VTTDGPTLMPEQFDSGMRAVSSHLVPADQRHDELQPADPRPGRRGWLMRRLLLGADVVGLSLAFALTEFLCGNNGYPNTVGLDGEIALFVLTLPIFLVGARMFGLYDRDEQWADYSTSDDLVRVFLLATVGVFLVSRGVQLVRGSEPDVTKATVFWALMIVCVAMMRSMARILARRRSSYVQNTVIVGAGDIGQLIGRKLLQHREFGLNLLGFVDDKPKEPRPDIGEVTILGGPDELAQIVRDLRVDRVIFAFSNNMDETMLPQVRSLRDRGVQVDVVPRLFGVVGPRAGIHAVEGMPLVGLQSVRIPRFSRASKRALDLIIGTLLLVPTIVVFAVVAPAIKLDSPGPVLFRQRRLGKDMREFTLLKFRTMRVGEEASPHRAYIARTASEVTPAGTNGLYKLDRKDSVTRVGRWLRKFSLDELPQLINVLKGDMSLVGPRPCLAYEVEYFAPHHLDRFLVPAGMTGLWQVSARGRVPFSEALDLDVLYAHSWSLGLDLELMVRTPLQLIRANGTV
jgi:exopolysaccharide biosynthesis polyprenyl glycosylphosphotransferase